jgi:hypothetical protein
MNYDDYDYLDEEECESYLSDKIASAKESLFKFFKGRKRHDGKVITPEMLESDRYINILLNYDVHNGMDYIYEAIEGKFRKKCKEGRNGNIPEDVQYVIKLCGMCSLCKIPQEFSTGTIIIYLELCKGLNTSCEK